MLLDFWQQLVYGLPLCWLPKNRAKTQCYFLSRESFELRVFSPDDFFSVENRAFHASSFVVPFAIVLLDFGYARETDSDAAGHRPFHRDLTLNASISTNVGNLFHHDFGPASDNADRLTIGETVKSLSQHIGHKSLLANRSIIGAKLNGKSSVVEIRDSG